MSCIDAKTAYNDLQNSGIYLGVRGKEFRKFLKEILRKTITKDVRKILLNKENMKVYEASFTSDLVSEDNYQVYEQLGDLAANHALVQYFYKRFPQLKCSEGVKVVARLRINYGATKSFFEIARNLGFWKYISAPVELRQRKMKSLLEDVFEAFLGATESIIDSCVEVGSGYKVIYSILENIFDDMDISLKYEDLYDAKTRIKETFDSNNSLGTLQYYETSTPDLKVKSEVRRCAHNGQKEILGIGIASLKQDAQQEAAKNALKTLFSRNIFKPIPKIYKKFNDNEDLLDVIIKPEWSKDGKLDINELQSTKKSKYQSRYKSTPLAFYCKKRSPQGIAECLKLGGKLDIQDTDGMYPLDLLFMGKIDIENVVNILKIISTYHKKLMIHSSVLTEYKNEYIIDQDFNKMTFKVIE